MWSLDVSWPARLVEGETEVYWCESDDIQKKENIKKYMLRTLDEDWISREWVSRCWTSSSSSWKSSKSEDRFSTDSEFLWFKSVKDSLLLLPARLIEALFISENVLEDSMEMGTEGTYFRWKRLENDELRFFFCGSTGPEVLVESVNVSLHFFLADGEFEGEFVVATLVILLIVLLLVLLLETVAFLRKGVNWVLGWFGGRDEGVFMASSWWPRWSLWALFVFLFLRFNSNSESDSESESNSDWDFGFDWSVL
jgi:hypothetical protein